MMVLPSLSILLNVLIVKLVVYLFSSIIIALFKLILAHSVLVILKSHFRNAGCFEQSIAGV